jgi:hypothetical protein
MGKLILKVFMLNTSILINIYSLKYKYYEKREIHFISYTPFS